MTISPSYPDILQNGTIADATQVMADFYQIQNDVNANAAANGANSDITSLTGLTTPLGVLYGGTGSSTAAGARTGLGLGTAAVENLGAAIIDDGAGNLTVGTNKITNAMLTQMAANTIKLNNTGSPANAIDGTATQATAMLNAFVGDSGSGGTKGLVPAPAAGDSAASKFLAAGGTWTAVVQPIKAWCKFNGTLTGTNAPTSGLNVTSVTRNNTGDYTVTFASPLSNANYATTASFRRNNGTARPINLSQDNTSTFDPSTNSFRFQTFCDASTSNEDVLEGRIVFVD